MPDLTWIGGRDVLLQLGLTRAEADIAMAVAAGRRLTEIAARRQVSLTTVRNQLKSVFRKLDVSRQAELAAKLRHLV